MFSRFSFTATAASALAIAVTACSGVPRAFGPTPSAARTNADQLFGALTARFTNVSRAPRYARARELLGRYALTPSVIYNDTSIWTESNGDTRTLYGDATATNGRYLFTNVPNNDPLTALADGRHIMRLRKLSDDEYSWFTGVDFAAGTMTADDLLHVINAWIAATENKSAPQIRQDAATAFPKTKAALGKLFTLDTLISARDPNGGNNLYLGIRLTPDGIRPTLPNYAGYLDKYIKRIKARFTLSDATNTKWLDASLRDGYLAVRLRSNNGHFAPLTGPVSSIPDTLTLRVEMTAKISLFTVGVDEMIGEWVNVNLPHERGWSLRFTKEPDWHLPPTAGTLLKSPLRRPFQGQGTQFRLTFRDTPGQQSILGRRGTTTVQESAVLRFLGKLGGAAMGDFVSKAEDEENRFNQSVFEALKTDVDAAL